ncbi:MAG: hypothetical protein U5J83_10595 [Bryobacterales bacterium]|nr:hypothetical protein [Bryobacterales bacterium]
MFLTAGLIGYHGLLHAEASDALPARIVKTARIHLTSGDSASTLDATGPVLELTLALNPANPVVKVNVRPLFDSAWAVGLLALRYQEGGTVRLHRSEVDPARYEVAGLSQAWLAFLPILFCCLGVLCLAASLRFAPPHVQSADAESTTDASPGREWRDLLHPNG